MTPELNTCVKFKLINGNVHTIKTTLITLERVCSYFEADEFLSCYCVAIENSVGVLAPFGETCRFVGHFPKWIVDVNQARNEFGKTVYEN